MDTFTISQLSRFSGIKPHTIRIWEQRYQLLNPARSEGNTRYYNSKQLRRLLNIVSLQANTNRKVSDLSRLSDDKLNESLASMFESTKTEASEEYFIAQLVASALTYDEPSFNKIFSHCLLRYGMQEAYKKLLYPLLIRIGLMWSADTIPTAQEHFISNLLRQKLAVAIDALPAPKETSPKWLLFLPEDEFHEIGLLFAQYMIRLAGHNVIYLGANLPAESLVSSVAAIAPDCLLVFFIHNDSSDIQYHYLERVRKIAKQCRIYVAASEKMIHPLKKLKNIQWLSSWSMLEQELKHFV